MDPRDAFWTSPDLIEALENTFRDDKVLYQLCYGRDARPSVPLSFMERPCVAKILQDEGYLEIPIREREACIDFDIHPIFQKPNWRSVAPLDEAYERMLPALALASKFITTDELLGFWTHLEYGKMVQQSGKYFLQSDPFESTPEARAQVKSQLALLANRISFFWIPNHENEDLPSKLNGGKTGRNCHAFCAHSFSSVRRVFNLEYKDWSAKNERQLPLHPSIGVSLAFYYHLLSPASPARTSPCQNMCLQFELAYVLVHELAHAYNDLIYKRVNGTHEPYVNYDDLMPEWGLAWEKATFGASITHFSIWRLLSCTARTPMASATCDTAHSDMRLCRPIPMAWIQSWFLKETWEKLPQHASSGFPNTPLPIGQPRLFIAERLQHGQWEHKLYLERKEVKEGPFAGTVSEPPRDQCIQEWYRGIIREEVRKAAKYYGYDPSRFLAGPRGGYGTSGQLYDKPPEGQSLQHYVEEEEEPGEPMEWEDSWSYDFFHFCQQIELRLPEVVK